MLLKHACAFRGVLAAAACVLAAAPGVALADLHPVSHDPPQDALRHDLELIQVRDQYRVVCSSLSAAILLLDEWQGSVRAEDLLSGSLGSCQAAEAESIRGRNLISLGALFGTPIFMIDMPHGPQFLIGGM